ncbi:iron-containing alcohol dehydrogenase [Butyricicoccus pullicaecorum]|uniref:Alcohol dehydrogenase n=1 Tax=Butyricicoccus pullicaecorum TaxID=501571 RepID=A0A1Y4LN67_9FIRM|nr:iron-containing alcohol dehydrogenase [Butyricicoccus pullicaecorum]OUP58137.1 alcohol dehydrogenase [Butyricicoccus pullicaecorum]
MKNFSYYMPTRIFFGAGSVKKLSRAPLPAGRGLLITGGSSTTKLGYVDKVCAALAEAGHEMTVYRDVQPNPTIENVRECAAIAREQECTFVVGLGGGSSIDTAKAAAVMATNDGDWWDYVYGGSGKGQKIKNQPLPIVAITTTAGTGTEADPWTVVTNGEEKIGGGNDKTFPTLSIVDPDFMMTVPPHLTAYQGFDALFHACEGYLATIASPVSEMYSLKAIELIGKSLPRAVQDGSDAEARADVALANTLAGFVESLSSCTSEHAIEHAMSGFHPKLPHGAGLIMISLEYYKLFADVCADKFAHMAHALGRADGDFVAALAELQKQCGVDNLKMSDYGMENGDFGKYADHAFADMGGLFRVDAKQLTKDDVIGILSRSYR